ncbi:RAD52 motif-containing protein 1-like [Lingula anatina]|uniref:RAD52 motif-containing protein 1-like n=1 Tax=Lingula anatina TaxID=7574 RepID=A0A1S3JKT9_LINAN|nr:RAD52 motif-containing protein 1-like [Lingula anatina]|eukprot:XP_013410519.1 RAD52 motif-containing protein 1-like [Lingula anatina]
MISTVVDLIEFMYPTDNLKNLYLTRIPLEYTDDELTAKLEEIFSKYGLLFEIQVFNKSGTERDNDSTTVGESAAQIQQYTGGFAFIKYYSAVDAARAKSDLNNKLILNGKLIRIQFARRKNHFPKSRALPVNKCYDLANYYLGFNGWNTEIISMNLDTSTGTTACCTCGVKVSVPAQGVSTTGYGEWKETFRVKITGCLFHYDTDTKMRNLKFRSQCIHPDFDNYIYMSLFPDPGQKLTAVCKAKKFSYKIALEDAFSHLIIVSVSGKISVEINTSTPCNVLEKTDGVIQINELEEPPVEDEDSFDSYYLLDDSEDQDKINEQILLALEAD